MATTLANLRAKLNYELGVDTDGETAPWSAAQRNAAISDGYAALWRYGAWKATTQTITTVDDTWGYALTTIRYIDTVALQDSGSLIFDQPKPVVQDDGSGAYNMILQAPIVGGYSMVVHGWGPYKSVFSGDSDTDDLAAEYNRVPLLKAKAILFRAQMGRFARYGERQSLDPAMNVSVDQLIGVIAAAEREFIDEVTRLRKRRTRYMRPPRALVTV